MANKLDIGDRRFGQIYDDDPTTPDLAVTLERTETDLVLTVPWVSPEASPYSAWFMPEESPDGEQTSVAPPRQLQFHDSEGRVTLIGCRNGGYHTNWVGPGSGKILAQRAIFGVQESLPFDTVHGMQSSVSQLRSWVGMSSWAESFEPHSKALTYRSEFAPDVDLGQYAGAKVRLCAFRAIRHPENPDRIELENKMRIETITEEPAEWDRHLRAHRALRDLMVISRWHDETCTVESVRRNEDAWIHPERGALPLWRDVVSSREDTPTFPQNRNHFLRYSELGPEGIRRWFGIRDRFQRAIDPVVSSIQIKKASPTTLLAQVGPGLEALGYELLRRDGLPKAQASAATLAQRLARVVDDIRTVLPFDGDEWVQQTARVYNGIKHANRKLPDELAVLNTYRECVLAVRAWCALELTVPVDELKARVAEDPQSHAWIAA